jgi:hypothetical protein
MTMNPQTAKTLYEAMRLDGEDPETGLNPFLVKLQIDAKRADAQTAQELFSASRDLVRKYPAVSGLLSQIFSVAYIKGWTCNQTIDEIIRRSRSPQ